MDGLRAMNIIKADPATSAIKIICVTSHAEGDRDFVLEVGFDDYIPKPIDTRALPWIVRKHLDSGRHSAVADETSPRWNCIVRP
jgi:two-component system cell cycle response regulator DivK